MTEKNNRNCLKFPNFSSILCKIPTFPLCSKFPDGEMLSHFSRFSSRCGNRLCFLPLPSIWTFDWLVPSPPCLTVTFMAISVKGFPSDSFPLFFSLSSFFSFESSEHSCFSPDSSLFVPFSSLTISSCVPFVSSCWFCSRVLNFRLFIYLFQTKVIQH